MRHFSALYLMVLCWILSILSPVLAEISPPPFRETTSSHSLSSITRFHTSLHARQGADLLQGLSRIRFYSPGLIGRFESADTPGQITEHTPWYKSATAIAFYCLLFLVLSFILLRIHLRVLHREKNRLREEIAKHTKHLESTNHLLEKQKEEIQFKNEQLREQNRLISELDMQKTKYFTNISHELRNLITLIKTPIENLIRESRIPKKCVTDLEMIQRNSGRLIELVNQLLDISRLDRGKMKLKMVEANVFDFAHAIAVSFTAWAEAKGINYRYFLPDSGQVYWFDADKLEKVISNLLSNAFKFTDIGGGVILEMEILNPPDGLKTLLEVKVIDTGLGIPPEEHEKIFDRFYQAESGLFKEKGGTGLGLALAFELVQLMNGTIKVLSGNGKGSEFIVQIPLGLDHLDPEEYTVVDYSHLDAEDGTHPERDLFPSREVSDPEDTEDDCTEAPLILVVEDHPEVRSLIVNHLKKEFRVIEASKI